MERVLRQKVMVKPGGVIEICSPALSEGALAAVIVRLATRDTGPLGWPKGFFERVAGSLPDFPDIEPEGTYEIREKLTCPTS
jgi:hypothetical protein